MLASFAAGCFWGVEQTFSKIPGVLKTSVGYTGGTLAYPSYEQVCSGNTRHAEAIQIEFDPKIVSYEQLLAVFWEVHNPTTLNRQGPDIGSQYRSAIFYHNEQQKYIAENSKKEEQNSGKRPHPIVTEISPASIFYPAEEYHQKYYEKQGGGYCGL
jgi:peptide-methionine (S)-S-oxide reductase